MTSATPHSMPLSPEQLSAVYDGEVDGPELDHLCRQWAEEDTRARWHTWSLVGDVMRSEDLAQTPSHDARFLAGLRERLAQEPVVFAPAALSPSPEGSDEAASARSMAGRRRTRYWLGTAAVAASVSVVVGTWVLQSRDLPQPQSPTLAQAVPPEATVPPPLAIMVRDPELDRYLAAHRQYVQGPALAAPGGVRQVSVNPGR